jgi:hypothetical protein
MSDVPQTRKEMDLILADGQKLDIQALAQEHSESMLNVLVKTAKGHKKRGKYPSHSVSARAAKDVLEIADGKPATKEPERRDAGITVIVQQLFGGERHEKVIPAVDLAAAIAERLSPENSAGAIEITEVDPVAVVGHDSPE